MIGHGRGRDCLGVTALCPLPSAALRHAAESELGLSWALCFLGVAGRGSVGEALRSALPALPAPLHCLSFPPPAAPTPPPLLSLPALVALSSARETRHAPRSLSTLVALAAMDQWAQNKLPERLPFSKKRLPKRVIFSYIIDYLIIVYATHLHLHLHLHMDHHHQHHHHLHTDHRHARPS
jgi:hypothetical protein